MRKCFIMITLALFSNLVFAQDAKVEEAKFKGESEASSVVVTGNSSSQTLSAKTKNTYQLDEVSLFTGFGSYLQASTNSVESGRAWTAGARYDYIFTKDVVSAFIQRKAESDPYNGSFVQRDITELGAKYIVVKSDDLSFFVEAGYQSQDTYAGLVDNSRTVVPFARVYAEAEYKVSESTKSKLWVEQLANLDKTSENQTNAELSLSVSISKMFSLKSAYLWNRNEAILAPLKKDQSKWTTALVATY